MSEYVKKPVVIEAFRYGIDVRPDWFDSKVTANEIITHCGTDRKETQDYYCEIKTLEGVMTGRLGDYIIKGVNGECYPCKPDIFEKTYSAYQPKRKPLTDGVLPMTDEELREFNKIVADFIKRFFQITYQNRVKIYEDKVCLVFKHDYTRDEHLIFVSELKAILYLATLFDLEV